MLGLNAADVRAMAVSGQQHGLVALDAAGAVLRPAKLWCDSESAPQAARLSELFGWEIQPAFTATKLLWLKENEPERFARLAMVRGRCGARTASRARVCVEQRFRISPVSSMRVGRG